MEWAKLGAWKCVKLFPASTQLHSFLRCGKSCQSAVDTFIAFAERNAKDLLHFNADYLH